MTSVVINEHEWLLGDRLGSGGFGQVYAATCGSDERVVKLVPLGAGGVRELLIGSDLSEVPSVVPILGWTRTDAHYALLMPRAEQSLRSYLDGVGGSVEAAVTLPILIELAQALNRLSLIATQENRIGVVHRDLKPENVLLFGGRWCLSDFGISRYSQASTETDTRRYHMTWQYAAPEQWRGETATSQTDVYALGVIAYELLAGVRPFLGPGHSEYREQHLRQAPPEMIDAPAKLATLINECLYKDAGTRPTPSRLLARLGDIANARIAPTGGRAALQEAQLAETIRRGGQAADRSGKQSEEERRAQLLATANREIEWISAELKGGILSGATFVTDVTEEGPLWAQFRNEREWMLSLNMAELMFQRPPHTELAPLRGPHPLDVITHATLVLAAAASERRVRGRIDSLYVGRSHSLWYCDAEQEAQYGWYELAFIAVPGTDDKTGLVYFDPIPFALDSHADKIARALPCDGEDCWFYRLAWPITRIMDDLDGFIDRWITWFADASRGKPLPAATQVPRRPGARVLAKELNLPGDLFSMERVERELSKIPPIKEAVMRDRGYLDESGLVRPQISWPDQ